MLNVSQTHPPDKWIRDRNADSERKAWTQLMMHGLKQNERERKRKKRVKSHKRTLRCLVLIIQQVLLA